MHILLRLKVLVSEILREICSEILHWDHHTIATNQRLLFMSKQSRSTLQLAPRIPFWGPNPARMYVSIPETHINSFHQQRKEEFSKLSRTPPPGPPPVMTKVTAVPTAFSAFTYLLLHKGPQGVNVHLGSSLCKRKSRTRLPPPPRSYKSWGCGNRGPPFIHTHQ